MEPGPTLKELRLYLTGDGEGTRCPSLISSPNTDCGATTKQAFPQRWCEVGRDEVNYLGDKWGGSGGPSLGAFGAEAVRTPSEMRCMVWQGAGRAGQDANSCII